MNPRKLSSLFRLFAISFLLTVMPAAGQNKNKVSAREIFYAPPVDAPSSKKPVGKQSKRTEEKKPVESAKSKPASRPSSNTAQQTPNMPAQTIPAVYTSEDTVRLGLRYSIFKREGTKSLEVDSDTVFHSGDRIQLRIDVNTDGYLYIINRGSSGSWIPLFPSSRIANGDNRVKKGTGYEIPPGYVFTFDEKPGSEKLFIVFSRQPVSDLEGLIYSLTGGENMATPDPKDDSKILLAQASILDSTVDRIRAVYSRDLIIEKVDQATAPASSAPAKEKAVYIANPSRSSVARLVADVTLIHK